MQPRVCSPDILANLAVSIKVPTESALMIEILGCETDCYPVGYSFGDSWNEPDPLTTTVQIGR